MIKWKIMKILKDSYLKFLPYMVYDINSDYHNLPHVIATSSL